MNQAEALYDFFKTHPKYRGVEATENMLITNCQRPVTVQTLEAAALRLGDRLAVSGDYSRAYGHFFALHPEIEDCDATRNILDREHHGDDISAESLEELFQMPYVRVMLPESTKTRKQRAENAHRAELIEFISQGKNTYGAWSKHYGQVRWYKTEDLRGEPTSTLEEIADILREQRNILNTTPEERREATIREAERQQKQTVEIINPATGVEYTASELKRLDRSEYRRLLCTKSGQVRPEIADRITKILKGQI